MKKNSQKRKLVVIGLDGVPCSLIKKMAAEGKMPFFSSLLERGVLKCINSSLPPVSSVAWSEYMTGASAGVHDIFGFIDRRPDPFSLYIPTADDRKAPTLIDRLSKQGKRCIVLNVPLTYPPQKINGLLVAGFLATDLDRATYPAKLSAKLRELGYIIDVDTWEARESREKFLDSLQEALAKRFKVAGKLISEEEWDYFHCHIMETDRFNHFFWSPKPAAGQLFTDFYGRLDRHLARLLDKIPAGADYLILSDHGFCPVKKEVQLNYWLQQKGYLSFSTGEPESLADMAPASRAYSLVPGRIYLNLRGREERGSVAPAEYKSTCREIKNMLLNLQEKETGDMIIDRVLVRDDIYQGPFLNRAPDLLALPGRGYDLKSGVKAEGLFTGGIIRGMHTFADAFICTGRGELGTRVKNEVNNLRDIYHILQKYFAD